MTTWIARKLIRLALRIGRLAMRIVGAHRYFAIIREEMPTLTIVVESEPEPEPQQPIIWN